MGLLGDLFGIAGMIVRSFDDSHINCPNGEPHDWEDEKEIDDYMSQKIDQVYEVYTGWQICKKCGARRN